MRQVTHAALKAEHVFGRNPSVASHPAPGRLPKSIREFTRGAAPAAASSRVRLDIIMAEVAEPPEAP